jgi:hypothetical protein
MSRLIATAALLILMTSGCDDRAAQIAIEGAQRQAEQNRSMAKLHEHVAAGAKRLAEEEAAARKQALVVHQELQLERSQLSGGWNQLEAQRQAIAEARRTESFLAALVQGGGAVLAGVLALAFGWLALYGLRRDHESPEVCELLLQELETPLLLPGGPSLEVTAKTSKDRPPLGVLVSAQSSLDPA